MSDEIKLWKGGVSQAIVVHTTREVLDLLKGKHGLVTQGYVWCCCGFTPRTRDPDGCRGRAERPLNGKQPWLGFCEHRRIDHADPP